MPPVWRKFVLVPAAVMLLAALGFGAYQVTASIVRRNSEAAKPAIGTSSTLQTPAGSTNDVASTVGGKNTGAATSNSNASYGYGERPIAPPERVKTVRVPNQTNLFAALNALASQGGVRVQIMPGVNDGPIALPMNGPNSLELPVKDFVLAIEQAAPVRIIDGGPEGYYVIPMDKTNNVGAQPGSESGGGNPIWDPNVGMAPRKGGN
jgi:hypothetical protein